VIRKGGGEKKKKLVQSLYKISHRGGKSYLLEKKKTRPEEKGRPPSVFDREGRVPIPLEENESQKKKKAIDERGKRKGGTIQGKREIGT